MLCGNETFFYFVDLFIHVLTAFHLQNTAPCRNISRTVPENLLQQFDYLARKFLKRLFKPIAVCMLYHYGIFLGDTEFFHIDRKIGNKIEFPFIDALPLLTSYSSNTLLLSLKVMVSPITYLSLIVKLGTFS